MKEEQSQETRSTRNRRRIIDAAESLLREGNAEFSMRALASEAGVSFATPFNHFGDKTAIMRALSARRIAKMSEIFRATTRNKEAPDRVIQAVEIAAAVMLEEPEINRAVMSALGSRSANPGSVAQLSRTLWAEAVGAGDGFRPELQDLACKVLPGHLALGFRGALSFWTAGEISDQELPAAACGNAAALLIGFLSETRTRTLIESYLDR